MAKYLFNGENVEEKKIIPRFWKWLLALTIISIVTVFGGDMVQQLLTPQLTSSDIVKNHYIKWESPLTVCDYKEYYNPTVKENVQTLSSVMEVKKGTVVNLGVEVLQITKINKTVLIPEQWIANSKYDAESKTNVTIWDVIPPKNETIEETYTQWVKNITKFSPKTLYTIRQCFTRKNVLDSFEIDVSVPFMELPLKEFTIINGSGYNETQFMNLSSVLVYWNFDNDYTNTSHTLDYYRNFNATNNMTTGQSGYINQSYKSVAANKNQINLADNSNFTFTNGTNGVDVPFTFCFALNVTTLVSPLSSLFAKYGTGQTEYNFNFGVAGNLNWALYSLDGSKYISRALNNAFQVGQYAKYCFSYDGSKYSTPAAIQFWINGTNMSSSSTNASSGVYAGMSDGTSPFQIANLINTYYLTGFIDDVVIYKNKALTKYEIENWNGTNRDFLKGIYGAYNSTKLFNLLKIISDCNYSMINVSLNTTDFTPLSDIKTFNFSTSVNGFYLRIDNSKCSYMYMNVSLFRLINNDCDCDGSVNWNPTINCSISSDCDIRPYNLSCATGNYFNITNGALVRFNTTNWGFNCSSYIKSTGLLSG